MDIENLRVDKRKGNEARSFNIKRLASNNQTQRILFESEDIILTCEIIGPYHQQHGYNNDCDYVINVNSELKLNENDTSVLKKDLHTIMSSIICGELYPKQLIQANFHVVKLENSINVLSECVNTLYYGLMCHGINLKDSFTSSTALSTWDDKTYVDPTKAEDKDKKMRMQMVYAVNSMRILHMDVQGEFSNDEAAQLISVNISACKQINSVLQGQTQTK